MNGKSPDAFRTISEVADWLDRPAHVLRFWESKFTQVKPVKRAGGRRYYRPEDMRLLGGIKKLLHDDGMTIKGAQKVLREQGVRYVSALSPPLDDEDVVMGMALDVTGAMVAARPMAEPAPAPVANTAPDIVVDTLSGAALRDSIDEADDLDILADDDDAAPADPAPPRPDPPVTTTPPSLFDTLPDHGHADSAGDARDLEDLVRDDAPPQSLSAPDRAQPLPGPLTDQPVPEPEMTATQDAVVEGVAPAAPSPAPAPIDAPAPQPVIFAPPAPQTAVLGRIAALKQPVPAANHAEILTLLAQLDALAARWALPRKA